MNEHARELIEFLRKNYAPEEKVKTEKDGSVTTFFRKAGKSLCYLTTKDITAKVTVVIGASLQNKVLQANLSEAAKKKFDDAKAFHDGKWLSFDLESTGDLEDVKQLLLIKRTPGRS